MKRAPRLPNSEALPSRLFVAVEKGVEPTPPVESRLQELPFDKLDWPNFEKLCHRLARSEADVEACRLYGDVGHDQCGIDLYARRAGREKWTVYQCKRVQDFGPSLIEAAVREFMTGELVAHTECLVLCTSESLRAPLRLDAIERMRDQLTLWGVGLEVWDSEELNTKLKTHPLLVADFFHEAWARSFCPFVPENLAQRLSAEDVRRFRQDCRAFYEQCFAQADAGWINNGSNGRPIPPLAQRFIGRDVLEKRSLGPDQTAPAIESGFSSPLVKENRPGAREQKQPSAKPSLPRISEARTALPDWLAHGGQFVLAGEPGAGKSTVLRFLALDLLSAAPTLTNVATAWGDHLPVWVPFPLWTRRIAERGATSVSLVELLREWLASYSNAHLWPLVERALADDRLLLLVDGLDEWRDESAARVALQLLHVFIGQRKTPAVLVGRPQGLSTLGPFPSSYREAMLAPLDRMQQRALVEHLLERGETATLQVDAFFRDLEQLPGLRTTAGIPLLLGLLLRQHLEHARLPLSRFLAGERMVDTLLRDHPTRRQQAALLCATPLLAERELRETFSYVAWRTQTERPEGLIERETVRDWLQMFLSGDEIGLGYPRNEARRITDELLRHGEREFGILVERAPGWFGFFHRTIQELLAAEYLGTMQRPAQLLVLRERTAHPDWREVLLAWCHRRPTADFAEIVTTLEEIGMHPDITIRHRVTELLAELATGDFPLPITLARRLAVKTVETVWTCEWPHHRRRLLDLVLNGLHGSHAVRSIVQAAVRAWYPARSGAAYLAEKTAKWPSSPDLIQALLRTLHHEEESAQRSAAEALGVFAADDPEIAGQLANLVKTSIRATTRACALEAFSRGCPDDPRLTIFTEYERRSGSGETAITAIQIRIRKNLQTAHDLKMLLRYARKRSFRTAYHWRDDLIEALLKGWPNSTTVKVAVIDSLTCDQPWQRDAMDHDMAFPILIRGFSGDEDAALAVAQFFQREKFIIHGLESHFTEWLPNNARWFAEHPKVAEAVETYLFRDAVKDDYSFALSSLLSRTERVKTHLLEALRRATAFPHWPMWALIHGWGISDPVVMSALREVIAERPELIADLAELVPQVFPDTNDARDKLLRCFEAEKISWPWMLLRGVITVDGHLCSSDALEACLQLESRAPEWERQSIHGILIAHAAPNSRVREMALAELDDHEGLLTSVAEGFGHDQEIRSRLIAMLAPLPSELRAVIVDRLESLPTGDPFAHDMLALFDSEKDGEVKARAAVAYSARELASASLAPSFIPRLRSLLHVVGSDNQERRQAALAALLELHQFDVIRSEFEGHFRTGGHWLFGESHRHDKDTLLRQLTKYWAELKQALGEDAFVEFTYQQSALSFASRLVTFTEGSGAANEWVQDVFSSAGRDGISFRLLDYLAQTAPGSERLLTLCIGVLQDSIKTPLYGWSDKIRTAELVAIQWSDDAEVLSKLTAGFAPAQLTEPIAIALSLGWPDSEALANYHDACVNEKRSVSTHVWHALGAVFAHPERIAKVVTRLAITRGGQNAYIFREAANYYVARLRRDDEAKRVFLAALDQAESADVRVTLAGLLARASPKWSGFHEWRAREISDSEARHTKAEFGYNLSTSNVENLYGLLTEEMI